MSRKRSDCTTPEHHAKLDRDNAARRVARGPSGHVHKDPEIEIAEGLELRAQTTQVNADGTLRTRYDKTHLARNPALFETVPAGHHVTKTTTRIDADGRVGMQYVTAKHDDAEREAAMLDAWKRHADLYKGLAGNSHAMESRDTDADLVCLYPLGDPHIGMMAWAPECGEHFDLKIACRELMGCMRLLVDGAPPARQCIITNLGDFLHAQNDEQRTPGHGHKLDVDGRSAKVLDAGHVLLRGLVDYALTKHEHVKIRNLPGNHDPQVAAGLAMWLRAVYEREPRVAVADAFAPYQFDKFGLNLFGWAHGDGAKAEALPLLMANAERMGCVIDGSAGGAWDSTTEHVWHTGHVHHLTTKEFTGCTVETHRTMAGKDFWHASKGYSAKRSMSVIGYHREHGEVTRNRVGLEKVRAALSSGLGL